MVLFVEKPLGNDDGRRSLCKNESRDEIESNALIEEECIEESQPISTNNKQAVDNTTVSVLDIDSNTDTDNKNNLDDGIRVAESESERLDVSKFMLVLLVVIGHFIEPYYKVGNKLACVLMHLIYSFHVPAFVCISGYTAGDYFNTKERRRKLISSLMLPYLILQPLFCVWYDAFILRENDMHYEEGKEDVSSSDDSMMFTPNWILYNQRPWSYFYPFAHLWYLISLLTMRIWRPFALEIRYTMVVHVLFGCLVGYSTSIGRFLSLHRTVVLMPYFLCGYIMKQKQCFFPYASSTQARILLLMTMFLLKAAAIFATLLHMPVEIWFQSDPYAIVYKEYSMYGGLFQLGCYAWTTLAMVAFFAIIPPPSICGVQYTAVETVDCDLAEIDEQRDSSCGYAAITTSYWRKCCINNSLKNRRLRPGQAVEKEQQSFLARVYLRLAKWGQRSLYAYTLHMAGLMVLVQFGYYDSLSSISGVSNDHSNEANEWKTTLQVLGTMVLSCALTVTLSLRTFFPACLQCVLEPDVEHILFDQEDVDSTDDSAILESRDQKDVSKEMPTEGV